MGQQRLGGILSIRKKNVPSLVISIIVLLTALRGFIPALSNGLLPAAAVYPITSVFAGFTAFYGFSLSLKHPNIFSPRIHNILLINLCLLMHWCFVEGVISGARAAPSFYLLMCGLAPFSIYVFTHLSEIELLRIARLITILLAGSVLIDFMLLNSDSVTGGYQMAEHLHKLIRQDGIPWFTRTGPVMRAPGITGNAHDSANILAMLSVFWLGKCLVGSKHRARHFSLFLFSIVALGATASAANLVVAFVGIGAMLGILLFHYRSRAVIPLTVASLICVIFVGLLEFTPYKFSSGVLTQWLVRIGPDGDWKTMLHLHGTWTQAREGLFWLIFGHGFSLGLPYSSEAALINTILSFGIIPGVFFVGLLLYPIWIFKNADLAMKKSTAPLIAALAVGVLSLSHYGSLLRSTSLYLFFSIYGVALKIMVSRNSNETN